MLIIQIALPCLLFASKSITVELKGGTNVPFSPQLDYTTLVFQPIAKLFGIEFNLDLRCRGYFPKGGGHAFFKVTPVKQLKAIEIVNRGSVITVYCRAFVSGNIDIATGQRMANHAQKLVHTYFKNTVQYQFEVVKETKAVGNGIGLL